MTANMISERTERTSTSWVRAHYDLYDGHAISRNSPGEANRAEAAALAWANQVAVGNSQMVTQNLLVRQMARDLERFDQKKAVDLSHYTYRGLSTLAGGGRHAETLVILRTEGSNDQEACRRPGPGSCSRPGAPPTSSAE